MFDIELSTPDELVFLSKLADYGIATVGMSPGELEKDCETTLASAKCHAR